MYLLDTNVVSEMRKGKRANAGVAAFFDAAIVDKSALFLSAVTLGEIRCGVERIRIRGDLPQADRLEVWLQSVLDEFHNLVLDFDAQTAQIWGVLLAVEPQNPLDKQIAATALLYDLTVVTRNERDFSLSGARVLNPWS